MITPFNDAEGRDSKADNLWNVLASKLGLKAPNMRQASAQEQKDARLSDAIQTHGSHVRENVRVAASDPAVTAVVYRDLTDAKLRDRYAKVFHRAVAELGQAERVKAADRLSRIEADMAAFNDKVMGLGGDPAMVDLCGEVQVKATAISGAAAQLREKVDTLSIPQAEAIENAFLLLSDAKTCLDKMGPAGMAEPAGLAVEIEMPGAEDVSGDIPNEPPPPLEEDESEKDRSDSGLTAGRASGLLKKAADVCYDDLRLIHTKLMLVASLLESLVAEVNVGGMLGGPEAPEAMGAPGNPPEGMPQTDQVPGEQKDLEAPIAPEASLCGRFQKFAGTGDPGDMEPGNLIYKDLGKCRDCVWFESDYTHETYRDKCKHCTHASLGGNVDHWWPRAHQMIMWIPSWGAPEAKEKKAFTGTLGLSQTANKVSAAAAEIARSIVSAASTAVELGSEFASYFADPVVGRTMPVIASDVASEVERLTGIEIGLTQAKADEWGRKAKLGAGEVVIACDTSIIHLAKGEKRKIKELREQLHGEKDAAKIKAINDAIDSLYSRIDADKKRKQDRKTERDERKKADQDKLDAEHAHIPATAASLRGTLCLGEKADVAGRSL